MRNRLDASFDDGKLRARLAKPVPTARFGDVGHSLNVLCGGYNYDSTSVRRPFDGRSTKVIKVKVTAT